MRPARVETHESRHSSSGHSIHYQAYIEEANAKSYSKLHVKVMVEVKAQSLLLLGQSRNQNMPAPSPTGYREDHALRVRRFVQLKWSESNCSSFVYSPWPKY
jgi:hypothetical protein